MTSERDTQDYADVAKRQQCYMVLGTIMEFDQGTGNTYCTAVVVGPRGDGAFSASTPRFTIL